MLYPLTLSLERAGDYVVDSGRLNASRSLSKGLGKMYFYPFPRDESIKAINNT